MPELIPVEYDPFGQQAGGEDSNYDYAAAQAAGVKPDERGHWPDTYKLPGHITFSDESKYNGVNGNQGGRWEQAAGKHWIFTAGPTNLRNYTPEQLRSYFEKYEPDSTLIIPSVPRNDPLGGWRQNLVPVDHDPFALLGSTPKPGQSVAQPDIRGGIASLRRSMANTAGDVTGINDAIKALQGMMTPEEAQKFALYAAAGLVTPEMRAARAASKAVEKVAPEAAQAVTQGIRAYHGSPYDFDKFDISKIGTGEGAQVYGHGLYFAENPATAKEYRASLANRQLFVDGKKVGEIGALGNDPVANAAHLIVKNNGDVGAAKAETYASIARSAQGDYGFGKSLGQKVLDQIDTLAAKTVEAREGGKMYEVNINADPEHFLDWDKPLSEQPQITEKIKASLPYQQMAAANHFGYSLHEFAALPVERQQKLISETSPKTHEAILWEGRPGHGLLQSFESSFGGSDKATEALHDAGIPGIKYLDQGSRNPGFSSLTPAQLDARISVLQSDLASGGGDQTKMQSQLAALQRERDTYKNQTHNYVVFNDRLVDIIKKYGLAGLIAGGAAHYGLTPVDHDPFAQ